MPRDVSNKKSHAANPDLSHAETARVAAARLAPSRPPQDKEIDPERPWERHEAEDPERWDGMS